MSKRANPTIIGAFVLGAILLGVGAVVYFGGSGMFAEKSTFVAFFEGSMKGLNVGAPVTFRGVRIGTVTNLVVRYDSQDQSVRVPVYFEIERGRVELIRGPSRDHYKTFRELIGEGLKAQLALQSFVTGQIALQLDFYPKEPAVYVGADPKYFEFPTIPSTLEKMGKALEDFEFQNLLDNLGNAAKGISDLANSEKLREAIASLDVTINDFGKLARNVDSKIDPLARSVDDTTITARRTLDQVTQSFASVEGTLNPAIDDARKLIQNVDRNVNPLVSSFIRAADTAQTALDQARRTLVVAKDNLAEDSELYRSVVDTLDELSSTARSIRMLADFLEQHPEALLQGKSAPGAP